MSDEKNVFAEIGIINEKISSVRCEIQSVKETISEHNMEAIRRSDDVIRCLNPLTKSIELLMAKVGNLEIGCASSQKEHRQFNAHMEEHKEDKKDQRRLFYTFAIACIGWIITLAKFLNGKP